MQNYNLIQKILHKICFKYKIVNKSLYEIEKLFYLNNSEFQNVVEQKHVFISGLARSGTTSILNYLYSSDEYASLTYKDMPFLLSVNLNSKIYFQKRSKPQIRAHNDGVYYNLDSPEALDEVFITAYEGQDFLREFVNYVSLILKLYNRKKYISKNNNNFKRINLIRKCFPNSKILIPFRDPLQHSYSLYSQHKNFLNLQKSDNFILSYMNYLGHNEFGQNHKPWYKPNLFTDNLEFNYWIEQWIKFYENILNFYEKDNTNIKLICYEKLKDNLYLTEINNYLEIDKINLDGFNISKKKTTDKFNNRLFDKAVDIYRKLNMFY